MVLEIRGGFNMVDSVGAGGEQLQLNPYSDIKVSIFTSGHIVQLSGLITYMRITSRCNFELGSVVSRTFHHQ